MSRSRKKCRNGINLQNESQNVLHFLREHDMTRFVKVDFCGNIT
jgi:hypothetical protein